MIDVYDHHRNSLMANKKDANAVVRLLSYH